MSGEAQLVRAADVIVDAMANSTSEASQEFVDTLLKMSDARRSRNERDLEILNRLKLISTVPAKDGQ